LIFENVVSDHDIQIKLNIVRNYLYYSVRDFFLIVVSWTFISHLCRNNWKSLKLCYRISLYLFFFKVNN
jgi:hypothetical protein